MSNCIEIYNHKVTFNNEEFDIEAFKKIIQEHETHKNDQKAFIEALILERPVEELKKIKSYDVGDIYCWFIRENSKINENKLEIYFGRGASSHTWRDFRNTIWFLNQFIKKPKKHTFIIADEADNFKQKYQLEISWPYSSLEELYKVI